MPNVFDQFDTKDEPKRRNAFDQFDDVPQRTEPTPEQPDFADAIGLGPIRDAAGGFIRGLQNAGTGVRQAYSALDRTATPEERAAENAKFQAEIAERDAKNDSGFAKVGSFAGEIAPSMMLPGGPAGGLARRVAGGAAADAAATVLDPVREGQSRGENVRNAALAGGALRVGSAALSGGARRITSGNQGDFRSREAADLVNTSDREGVRVFFDDISDSSLAKKTSQAAEYFERLGTGRGRATQNDEARAAAQRWLSDMAGDVDDYQEVVQSGLGRKLQVFQKAAAKKYDRAARAIGPGDVPTTSFSQAATDAIAKESAKGSRANPQVIEFIEKYQNAPTGDFGEMIEFRSDLLKEVRDFQRNADTLSASSREAIASVQKALDDDMANFARSKGAESAWRDANQFYRNTVVQFKKSKLKNLVNEDSAANFDSSSAWRYLTAQSSNNPERARKMFQSLDGKGRSAVRFGMLKEAMDQATVEGKPFSPVRFASYFEKREPVYQQFFRGQSGEEIKGLVRLMRHIDRAGQYAENPPTGQRLILPLLAGAAAFEPATAITAGGSAFGVKTLFQTKAGRNLLLAASNETPGSKKFDQVVEQIVKLLARSQDTDSM